MNRENYPAFLFPFRGDLSAEAGATTVEVIGLQNTLIGNLPTNGQVPTFVAANGDIEWRASGGGSATFVNGIQSSSDYLFLVNTAFTINYGSDDFLGVRINGTRDGG